MPRLIDESDLQRIEHDPASATREEVQSLASELGRLRAKDRALRPALEAALRHGDSEDLYLSVRSIVDGDEAEAARLSQPIPEHD